MEASLTPLYQQVMDSIKDDVDSGKYQTGQRIPSEGELSQIYSVSRITVRRAVSELVDRG
ncbi:GntR family transcriptional regulator [Parafannyhessea umbonata]|uniref:GntR family transcriptional regulator n=1 Tax=Parafannyhessea umbonata TaxID=604330 RepID=UPI0021478DE6|nr:GntR family transcriptional regulator [Parafannyhessea umbonata]